LFDYGIFFNSRRTLVGSAEVLHKNAILQEVMNDEKFVQRASHSCRRKRH
jgi:hypothetical protein